jgi:hypothetical protein
MAVVDTPLISRFAQAPSAALPGLDGWQIAANVESLESCAVQAIIGSSNTWWSNLDFQCDKTNSETRDNFLQCLKQQLQMQECNYLEKEDASTHPMHLSRHSD